MRFLAPGREAVSASIFDQPVFAGMAEFRDLLTAPEWTTVADLNERLSPLAHQVTGKSLSLVEQSALVADPIHYELRIFQRGEIATRAENWHDLLNALIWKKFPAIKSALNALQAENIARVGTQRRTREQDALTQFDEAGAVLILRDRNLLDAWDAHDWPCLFLQHRDAWHDGRISLAIFGHALLEHALRPELLLVAKTLVFFDEGVSCAKRHIDQRAADAIAGRTCLRDPQQLRPLPLSGVPGWHQAIQDSHFYREMPCFRPLRSGRTYPPPMPIES